jgi:signal peptidase I
MSAVEVADRKPSGWRSFIQGSLLGMLLVFACLVLFALLPSNVGPLFRLFDIPANSMAPTLPVNSYVIASHLSYGYSRYSFSFFSLPIKGRWCWSSCSLPKRGDAVVFRLPRDHKTFYVKRIVGLPGDRIQMINGVLNINGEPVKRERAGEWSDPDFQKCGTASGQLAVPLYQELLPDAKPFLTQKVSEVCKLYRNEAADNTEVFQVPDGNYFMLGDNRDNSNDSRFGAAGNGGGNVPLNGVGYVPLELILGRVVASF